eukprot:GHVU01126960.1.p2 GENE.GHVU01126960.1~~GHVU01126960.1.p2  ORF type:complete len:104 (+),score=0.99 GHVU01126960.1:127-438(+)
MATPGSNSLTSNEYPRSKAILHMHPPIHPPNPLPRTAQNRHGITPVESLSRFVIGFCHNLITFQSKHDGLGGGLCSGRENFLQLSHRGSQVLEIVIAGRRLRR